MLYLILFILLIVFITKNSDLKKEIENLKSINVRKINFCRSCGSDLRGLSNATNFCPSCGNNLNFSIGQTYNHSKIVQQSSNVKKEKRTEKEIKNNLILIMGSILIVLAAIVFLTSTWNYTHKIIKTGVLIAMLAVFLAMSYASNKYFNLKQTSKTFFYIALGYIPIILLSISMFSLFGDYLSLYGEGNYIFLTISSILVSLIYHIISNKYSIKTVFSFGIIFQLLSIIFFISIFSDNISIIYTGLFCYSNLISILYLKNQFYFNKDVHLKLSTILFIVISSILVLSNSLSILFNNINVFDLVWNILLFINIYLLLIKIHKTEKIYNYFYPIVLILIFNNLAHLFDIIIIRQLIIIISFVLICFYNLIRENKINIITYIEILIGFSMFNFVWLFNSNLLDSYILFSIMSLLNVINYLHDEKYKDFSSIVLSIGIIITVISISIRFDISAVFIGYVSLLLILIKMIFKNLNKSLKRAFKWVGISTFIMITLFLSEITILSLLLFVIFIISSFRYGVLKKDNFFKIISYIYLNLFMFNLFDFIGIDYMYYVIPFTTILVSSLEVLFPKIRSKESDNYLVVSYILSNLALIFAYNLNGFIASLILNLIFAYYIIYYKKNHNYLCVSFLGMIPYIYMSDVLVVYGFNIMYIISILILSVLCSLIYEKKKNFYITMYYLYSSFHIISLEENKYLGILLLIISTIVCYLVKNNKVKDLYKAILYLFSLILYNFIIFDLNINDITALSTGIYIILTLLYTRTIFKKYGNSYKIWEYILCSFINFIALFICFDWNDRLLYILFLVLLVIISYVFKFGPVFLICLISILINTLFLIGSVPWWMYILIIGSILITFAIYNEVKDKQQERKDTIKKYLDL